MVIKAKLKYNKKYNKRKSKWKGKTWKILKRDKKFNRNPMSCINSSKIWKF